jgi:hypothetical protein
MPPPSLQLEIRRAVHRAGGWSGLEEKLAQHFGAHDAHGMTHIWSSVGSASSNSMGIEIFGLVMGLGFVLSFGYWCTDFLWTTRASRDEVPNARYMQVEITLRRGGRPPNSTGLHRPRRLCRQSRRGPGLGPRASGLRNCAVF